MQISRAEINKLHAEARATFGVEYVDEFGIKYVGTVKGRIAKIGPTDTTVIQAQIDDSIDNIDVTEVDPVFNSWLSAPPNLSIFNNDVPYLTSVVGFVPDTRTLTINGTAFDLSADRTWSVGTVTSVAMTTPTGLSVTGSPIITSGTLALTFTSGYSIPTTSSQTNWDTAYTNRITSLTTTGTSGAATLVANVLNIPQYQAAGTYVTSVSGTANRITSSGGTTPIIDIAATYVGQSSITTLGTITSGTWNGTAIANANLANSSITVSVGTSGTDFATSGSPVSLGGTVTLNLPSASATARGVITTGTQTIAGAKTLSSVLQVINGAAAAPSIISGQDSQTGIYFGNSPDIRFAVSAGLKMQLTAANLLFSGTTGVPSLKINAIGTAAAPTYAFTGDATSGMYQDAINKLQFTANGVLALTISSAQLIGIGLAPTKGWLEIAAGTTTKAPLVLTSGTNNTTAQPGAFEYNGTNLFFTRTGTTRENVLVAVDGAAAPTTTVGIVTTNRYGGDTNVCGDPNRWLSVNVAGTVYKIPMYT